MHTYCSHLSKPSFFLRRRLTAPQCQRHRWLQDVSQQRRYSVEKTLELRHKQHSVSTSLLTTPLIFSCLLVSFEVSVQPHSQHLRIPPGNEASLGVPSFPAPERILDIMEHHNSIDLTVSGRNQTLFHSILQLHYHIRKCALHGHTNTVICFFFHCKNIFVHRKRTKISYTNT